MNYPVAYYPQPYPPTPQGVVVETGKHRLIDSAGESGKRYVAWGVIALTTVAVGGIAFLIARQIVRNQKALKTQKQSFGNNKHATWAKQLMQAFDNDMWWGMGTNEELIRQVMREIPSKEDFDKVDDKFREMTKGGSLIETMSEELSSTEYEEMLAIKNSKPAKAKDAKPGGRIYDPKGWAKRLHAAISYYYGWFPGTDEEAIKAVFAEFPSYQAYKDTKVQYQIMYHADLASDLDGDLDWSLDWRALLKKKPAK